MAGSLGLRTDRVYVSSIVFFCSSLYCDGFSATYPKTHPSPDLRQRRHRRDGRQRPTEKWEAVQQQVRNFTCLVKVIDHPPPRYAWFLTFSPEGKIIEIHEYLNTALLERVYAENRS